MPSDWGQEVTPLASTGGTATAWRLRCIVVVAVVASVLGLTGCSKVINAIKTAHNVLHQGAAISTLSNKLKAADTKSYEVSYVTTGANPVTTEYAALPPHDFAFGTTLSGRILDVISNTTGEYACSKSLSVTATWTCLKLEAADIKTYKAMYALYSGAYWIDFLRLYSAAAALQGIKINSTTMSVNGFDLSCVVITGSKTNPTNSKWCVTSQGVLGYVSVSAKSADFEIKSYSSSPSASLFQTPAGATITTVPKGTS
ncbi:MAG: hypothetical protein ACLPUG_18685 [Acidimicrobiales bacterium]|jgi:hypothetical protein